MKKHFLVVLVILAMILSGCGVVRHSQKPDNKSSKPVSVIKKQPVMIVAPVIPLVIPPVAYIPDPTFGKIKNGSRNVWVKIWVDPQVKNVNIERYDQLSTILGRPTLTLIPGLAREMYMDLGVHLVYAEGFIKTRYGWKSLGFTTKDVVVDSSISGGGHYGWYLKFRKGDFQR